MRLRPATLAIAALFILGSGAPLAAQARFGGEASFGDDTDFGIGARVVAPLNHYNDFVVIGTFDYFFPEDPPAADLTYWEINGNLAYQFKIRSAPSLSPYVGAGLNLAHSNLDPDVGRSDSDTDLGLNLLIGTQFKAKNVTPFAEIRVEAGGGDQLVLTGGLLF